MTKQAAAPATRLHADINAKAPEAPEKKEKPKRVVPGLRAHRSVLESLEHMVGKMDDAEVDAVLAQQIRFLKSRMKPWMKVSVQYVETSSTASRTDEA